MHSAKALQLACRCLPQRMKPQTAGRAALFRFSSFFLQFSEIISNSLYLQCNQVPFLYRAKNQYFLGLLALFFCHSICNTLIEEFV